MQLASLKNLDTLTVQDVPGELAKSLHAKLPHCTIVYNEPAARDRVILEGAPRPDTSSTDPDRAAAEWAIAMGGNVKVSTATAKDQMVNVAQTDVEDDALAFLLSHQNLTYLNVAETNVSDAFIEALGKALPNCEISRKPLW